MSSGINDPIHEGGALRHVTESNSITLLDAFFDPTDPVHTQEFKTQFEVRLAAAGRLRTAVALELVAGQVWALPNPTNRL